MIQARAYRRALRKLSISRRARKKQIRSLERRFAASLVGDGDRGNDGARKDVGPGTWFDWWLNARLQLVPGWRPTWFTDSPKVFTARRVSSERFEIGGEIWVGDSAHPGNAHDLYRVTGTLDWRGRPPRLPQYAIHLVGPAGKISVTRQSN
jgi:hypothetical protein